MIAKLQSVCDVIEGLSWQPEEVNGLRAEGGGVGFSPRSGGEEGPFRRQPLLSRGPWCLS